MKNLKIYSLILLALGVFSCTNLEEDPIGRLSPDGFFKGEKDVQLAINGAYGQLTSEEYWGRKYSLTIMLMSDMVDIGNLGTPSRRVQVNNFTSNSSNGMTSVIWRSSYRIIGTLNSAIEGAEVVSDETKKNELIGQARFFRAFVYFNLVRVFGKIPLIAEAVSDPEALTTIARAPEQDVYKLILEDLDFAKDHLPNEHPVASRALPAKGAAYTMLADVYLTLGNYQQAYEAAKYVIDHKADFGYELKGDYGDLFNENNFLGSEEHIFAIEYKGLQSNYPYNMDYTPALTGDAKADLPGWSVAVPHQNVYDTWDARDYRKKVAMADSLLHGGVLTHYSEFNIPRPHIAKYIRYIGNSETSGNNSDINYAVYRFAEVYLIAAEALNEVSGPNTEVLGYINKVRERARNWNGTMTDFPTDVQSGLSKEEFREVVLEERRLELSFEFKRWWDVKRHKLGSEVFGPTGLEPQAAFNDDKYLLAIPQGELDVNPNLLPQNPGY